MQTPSIVTPSEWESARQRQLGEEKELTRARDALAADRRRMPWLAVEKEYAFDGPGGRATLLDLFEGRRGCSLVADQVTHVAARRPRRRRRSRASRRRP